MKDVLSVTKSRKFWTAVSGGLVTFLSIQFDSPNWLSGVTIALTALGVYHATNEK